MSNISPSGVWRRLESAWTTPQDVHAAHSASELAWAARCHYGPAAMIAAGILLVVTVLGSGLAWLVVFAFAIPWYVRGSAWRRSAFVAHHATESLNFQLTWLLVTAIGTTASALAFGLWKPVTVPLVLAISVAMLVMMTRAGQAASRGEEHRYPARIEFVSAPRPDEMA